MNLKEESLQPNDLEHLVDYIFCIDSYRSKMGDDADIVVLSFEVDGKEPANDLVDFFEKGYQEVLDADVSPGEMDNGKYLVFVELERSQKIAEIIDNIMYGVRKITNRDDFKFRYYKNFQSKPATLDELKKAVPKTPLDYKKQIEKKVLENYENFFSTVKTCMNDDKITFTKPYRTPVNLRFLESGPANTLIESITETIRVNQPDISEVLFLTKSIGNYNITKFGENKFFFEKGGYGVILEKYNEF